MNGERTMLRAMNMHVNRANINISQNLWLMLEAECYIVSYASTYVTCARSLRVKVVYLQLTS
jgi:hypothetical protein